MVSNTTFNNISVISWLSVLLVEEQENHRNQNSDKTIQSVTNRVYLPSIYGFPY